MFAVEVGGAATPGLRIVDLWVAGKGLTVSDNAAFVPSLCLAMRADALRVRHRAVASCPFPGRQPTQVYWLLEADETHFRERFRFLRWTEIVDNVSSYAYRDDDDLVIVFRFWRDHRPDAQDRGRVFSARIVPERFLEIVGHAAGLLETASVLS